MFQNPAGFHDLQGRFHNHWANCKASFMGEEPFFKDAMRAAGFARGAIRQSNHAERKQNRRIKKKNIQNNRFCEGFFQRKMPGLDCCLQKGGAFDNAGLLRAGPARMMRAALHGVGAHLQAPCMENQRAGALFSLVAGGKFG
jgi:hypothetical protein